MQIAPPNATPTLAPMGTRSVTANGDGTYTVTDPLDVVALLGAGWVPVTRASNSALSCRLAFNTVAASQYVALI